MHYMLVALQYENVCSYNILIKCNFCNFTLWMTPAVDARGRRPVRLPLYTPLISIDFALTMVSYSSLLYLHCVRLKAGKDF